MLRHARTVAVTLAVTLALAALTMLMAGCSTPAAQPKSRSITSLMDDLEDALTLDGFTVTRDGNIITVLAVK